MTAGAPQHLIVLPVLLPLVFAALLLTIRESRHGLKFAISLSAMLLQGGVALVLLTQAEGGKAAVYLAANWPAPFGIALVADGLAAVLLVLNALLGTCVLLYAMTRWSVVGVHFHSLMHFLMMGINGAFLTHDLFNLFVFFEISLAASYGLVLHGYTAQRLRAGMQYITINLAASLLFLIGVALLYATAGTLNYADLAARMPQLEGSRADLARIGAVTLCIAFLVKGGIWPLGFWLPTTYASASPPAAAMLVLLTKVGVYATLRLWPMLFAGPGAFGLAMLTTAGVVTVIFAAFGMLGSDSPQRIGAYGAVMSSGVIVAAVGSGEPAMLSAGIYYLVSSVLATSALMLLIELVERVRTPASSVMALTMEAFAVEETPEQPVGTGIPAALIFLGLAFVGCTLVITGVPPLSGFVAKFALLHALLSAKTAMHWLDWALLISVLAGGLAGIVAFMRFGVRAFWASGDIRPPLLRRSEAFPIIVLLAACILLTVHAGSVLGFLDRTAADIYRPTDYIEGVLGTPIVPTPPRLPESRP